MDGPDLTIIRPCEWWTRLRDKMGPVLDGASRVLSNLKIDTPNYNVSQL